jgi:regulator of sigma E protease
MAIVVSGPLYNFLFAILVFAVVYMIGVPMLTNQIGSVQQGGAAFEAGIEANDIIVKIDEAAIDRWDKMAEKINKSGGKSLKFTIQRSGGQIREFNIVPRLTKSKNIFGEEADSYKIGVGPTPKTVNEHMNPVEALGESLQKTWFITKMTLISIVKIFEGVISPKNLGGPILIAQMAGEQVKGGFVPFIFFMALLSINLGVLNLLPIPVLDGGHLFFYIIEAIRGRDINVKWKERAQQVGFILLIILMIFVMIMDIDRLNIDSVNDVTKILKK